MTISNVSPFKTFHRSRQKLIVLVLEEWNLVFNFDFVLQAKPARSWPISWTTNFVKILSV